MVDVNDENCGPFGDAKKINWNTRPCRLGRAGRCWDGSGSGHARELRAARVSRRASVAGPKPRIRPRIDRTRAVRSKFKTRLFDAEAAFQKPRVGGRKIGGGAPRTLADDARIVQGLTVRSIAIATPSITPGDAIGGVGSNDASRTRDARSTGGAGKRHVHHSPRRISESHWVWGRIRTALRRERGAGHESPRGLRRRTSWWSRCGVNRQGTGRGGVKRVGVLASRLPGWFHDSAATPRRRFFSLFRNFTFLVFGRGIDPTRTSTPPSARSNVWRLTTLKRTMTNMTNTQIRPKAPVEAPQRPWNRRKFHVSRDFGTSFLDSLTTFAYEFAKVLLIVQISCQRQHPISRQKATNDKSTRSHRPATLPSRPAAARKRRPSTLSLSRLERRSFFSLT